MKLATFRVPGRDEPLAGEVVDGRVIALEGGVGSSTCWRAPSRRARDSWSLDEVTLLAPVPRPGTVYAIGLNYAQHIKETGNEPPKAPIVFVKVANSVASPGGPIRCPEVVKRLDYEGELTMVISAGGEIAGFCVADDVTLAIFSGASRSGPGLRVPTRSARSAPGSPRRRDP